MRDRFGASRPPQWIEPHLPRLYGLYLVEYRLADPNGSTPDRACTARVLRAPLHDRPAMRKFFVPPELFELLLKKARRGDEPIHRMFLKVDLGRDDDWRMWVGVSKAAFDADRRIRKDAAPKPGRRAALARGFVRNPWDLAMRIWAMAETTLRQEDSTASWDRERRGLAVETTT